METKEQKYNQKNWSVREAIQNRVNLEDRHAWSLKEVDRTLPKYEKPKVEKLNGGVYNFIKGILNECRP